MKKYKYYNILSFDINVTFGKSEAEKIAENEETKQSINNNTSKQDTIENMDESLLESLQQYLSSPCHAITWQSKRFQCIHCKKPLIKIPIQPSHDALICKNWPKCIFPLNELEYLEKYIVPTREYKQKRRSLRRSRKQKQREMEMNRDNLRRNMVRNRNKMIKSRINMGITNGKDVILTRDMMNEKEIESENKVIMKGFGDMIQGINYNPIFNQIADNLDGLTKCDDIIKQMIEKNAN